MKGRDIALRGRLNAFTKSRKLLCHRWVFGSEAKRNSSERFHLCLFVIVLVALCGVLLH